MQLLCAGLPTPHRPPTEGLQVFRASPASTSLTARPSQSVARPNAEFGSSQTRGPRFAPAAKSLSCSGSAGNASIDSDKNFRQAFCTRRCASSAAAPLISRLTNSRTTGRIPSAELAFIAAVRIHHRRIIRRRHQHNTLRPQPKPPRPSRQSASRIHHNQIDLVGQRINRTKQSLLTRTRIFATRRRVSPRLAIAPRTDAPTISQHPQPHRPINNRIPDAALPAHNVRHTMFNLPRQHPPCPPGHSHLPPHRPPAPARRDPQSPPPDSPQPSSPQRHSWPQQQQPLAMPHRTAQRSHLRQPPQFFRLIRHSHCDRFVVSLFDHTRNQRLRNSYRSIPNNMLAIAPDRAT